MNSLRTAAIACALALVFLLPGAAIADNEENGYVVKPGDTIANIAAANGTSVGTLMRLNGITNPNLVTTGRRLNLPGNQPAVAPSGSAPAAPAVPAGAVRSISPAVDVAAAPAEAPAAASAEAPAEAPAAKPADANPSEAPAEASATALAATHASEPAASDATTADQSPADASPLAANGRYVVRAGDTLAKIAARFGVSPNAIIQANKIKRPDLLYTGMSLVIPGKTQVASKPAAPAAAPVRPSVPAAKPTTPAPTRFVASISQQHCWLYQNGALTADWVCSSGRRGSHTVPGNYRIKTKMERAWGATWGFWMPYWLGIYNVGSLENGIHGYPYMGAKQSWTDKLGTPITFGCILLDDANAKRLFNIAYIGMPVQILP